VPISAITINNLFIVENKQLINKPLTAYQDLKYKKMEKITTIFQKWVLPFVFGNP
jgi:hypothetical protein